MRSAGESEGEAVSCRERRTISSRRSGGRSGTDLAVAVDLLRGRAATDVHRMSTFVAVVRAFFRAYKQVSIRYNREKVEDSLLLLWHRGPV